MQDNKVKIIIGACLLLGIVLFFVGFCQDEQTDDREALRQLVLEGIDAAERHSISDLFDLTSDDFLVVPQKMKRKRLRPILMMAFRRYKKFTIKHPAVFIDLQDGMNTASAEIPFLIVRTGKEFPDLSELADDPYRWAEEAGEVADPYYLKLWFNRIEGEWLVYKARLKGVRTLDQL